MLKVLSAILLFFTVPSVIASLNVSFENVFRNHVSIMLLIDPIDGHIIDANQAATEFYGYQASEIVQMTIQQINMLNDSQVDKEMLAAKNESRKFFIFRHITAKQKIKTVQVYSSVVLVNKRRLLLSIIRDISSERAIQEQLWQYQTDLEAMVDEQVKILQKQTKDDMFYLSLGITVLSIFSIFLVYLLNRKIKTEQQVKALSQIVEQSPVSIATLDAEGNVTYGNKQFELQQALRCDAITAKQINFIESYSATNSAVANYLNRSHWQGEIFSFDINKQKIWELTNIHPLASIKNNSKYVVISQNITNLKKDEKKLRLASTVFQTATEAVMICDDDKKILAINKAFTEITGYTEKDAIGNSPAILKSGHHEDSFYLEMFTRLEKTGKWQGEICNRRKNGEVYYEWLSITALTSPSGKLEAYVSLFSDITKRKKSEDEIYHQANFDMLTGLANRNFFSDRIEFCLNVAERESTKFALMFIDLDGFKQVNDNLGHSQGDLLLQIVAKRLTKILRKSDVAARLGGDEFAIIMTGKVDEDTIKYVAQKIISDIAKPFILGAETGSITASVGITIYPEDGISTEDLLKKADSAMYKVKSSGRNGYRFYSLD